MDGHPTGSRAVRRRFATLGLALAALLALPAAASAAHDNLNTPEPLVLGYLYSDDNSAATTQASEPLTDTGTGDCNGARMGRTLWYRFKGTGREVTLATEDSTLDTVIAVYDMDDGGNFVDCDDDSGDDGLSTLTIETVSGGTYLLQVGSFDGDPDPADQPSGGPFTVSGVSPPPNDLRAAASALAAGSPSSGDNRGAITEAGEDLTCEADGDAPLRKTVWKRFTVAEEGDAVVSASGFDTVMQLYAGDGTGPIACNDDGVPGTPGPSRVGVRLSPGTYLVQVGGFGDDQNAADGDLTVQLEFAVDLDLDDDGSNRPADCDDRNGGIRPGASDVPENGVDENCDGRDAERLDRDGDNFNRPQDCRDDNPGINPGAFDVPANGVDENCDGRDAAAQLTRATYDWGVAPNGLTLIELRVRAPAGTRVTISCRGRRCFRRRSFVTRRSGNVNVLKRIPRNRRKRTHGSTLTLQLTQPNTIGKRLRLTFRRNRKTRSRQFCLAPNTNRRTDCP
jgi:hypothetical protein